MRRSSIIVAVISLAAAVFTAASAGRTAGTLELHAVFHVKWKTVDCPSGTPSTTGCYLNVGPALASGLGQASEGYVLLVEHTDTNCADWRFHVVITVAGKGSIEADASRPGCFSPFSQNGTSAYTITGGSGSYAGATGTGSIASAGTETGLGHGTGADAWTGTLAVPGLDFDTTPPALSGIRDRTVVAPEGRRAATARFSPIAVDAVDGRVPVSCKPRSGSRFKVGRTKVTCAAADRSGNAATASFRLTVRPG